MVRRAVGVALCAALVCALLSACGGDGGGDGAAEAEQIGITFSPAAVEAKGLEGYPQSLSVAAVIAYLGEGPVYLAIESTGSVVADVRGAQVNGSTLTAQLALRTDLPVGTHTDQLKLHACLDAECQRELRGSPATLPIRYTVGPNILAPESVELRRQGREPAPEALLPVSIPPEAGPVDVQVIGDTGWLAASLTGDQLQIRTTQVRAGYYRASVVLRSRADSRYERAVEVRYAVLAPPGGERELALDPPYLNVEVDQGAVVTHRFKVVRPTWTDAPIGITLPTSADGVLSLRELGNDEYELTIDASSKPFGYYYGYVLASGAGSGLSTSADVRVVVGSPIRFPEPVGISLDAHSTAADLQAAARVLTNDGVPARWTAASNSPWLRLLRSSGTTGIDELLVAVDPAVLATLPGGRTGDIEVRIDRPGTSPVVLPIGLYNGVPQLRTANTAVFVGTRGSVYIDGVIGSLSGLLDPGVLKVEGAQLRRAAIVTDPRFVSELNVLRVDLDAAVPGRDITIRIESPLLPTQLTLRTEEVIRAPAGHVALPHASYRPVLYSTSQDAVYFAGPDTMYRWAHAGQRWTLTSAAAPAALDVALPPGEQSVYVADGVGVTALDPVTLAARGRGSLGNRTYEDLSFYARAPGNLHVLAYSADLRAFATLRGRAFFETGTGTHWVQGLVTAHELVPSFDPADPGLRLWPSDAPPVHGPGIVRSGNGHALVAVNQARRMELYAAAQRSWTELGMLPDGVGLTAVSDDADKLVFSDGTMWIGGLRTTSLAAALPAGVMAGGYGLTADGRYGLVYGYRITQDAGAQQARDAALWVLDLSDFSSRSATAPTVTATVAMVSAVGCTSTPAAGETCRHEAHLTAAPGDGTVFVIGPRGLAAIPMPAFSGTTLRVPKRANAVRFAPSPR